MIPIASSVESRWARLVTAALPMARVIIMLVGLEACRGAGSGPVQHRESVVVTPQALACRDLWECERQCPDAPEACVAAGRLYEFGHGVDKDPARAFRFYQQACALSSAVGCYNTAVLLEAGRGVARDPKRAGELYAKVCAQGSRTACERSAHMAGSERATEP